MRGGSLGCIAGINGGVAGKMVARAFNWEKNVC